MSSSSRVRSPRRWSATAISSMIRAGRVPSPPRLRAPPARIWRAEPGAVPARDVLQFVFAAGQCDERGVEALHVLAEPIRRVARRFDRGAPGPTRSLYADLLTDRTSAHTMRANQLQWLRPLSPSPLCRRDQIGELFNRHVSGQRYATRSCSPGRFRTGRFRACSSTAATRRCGCLGARGDAVKRVFEPCLRVDAVELGCQERSASPVHPIRPRTRRQWNLPPDGRMRARRVIDVVSAQ